MVTVYVSPEVEQVRALYPYLADPEYKSLPIKEQIGQQANTLHLAHQSGEPGSAMQMTSWWPGAAGKRIEEILADDFSLEDARLTLSREHGFDSWEVVESLGDLKLDASFEMALDHMLSGSVEELEAALVATPELATARTRYGHGSTLLHYLGANGVESHRQCTPLNAVEIAALLLSRGADRNAEADMYGGGQTPFDLASTSAHPKRAGIARELNDVLKPC